MACHDCEEIIATNAAYALLVTKIDEQLAAVRARDVTDLSTKIVARLEFEKLSLTPREELCEKCKNPIPQEILVGLSDDHKAFLDRFRDLQNNAELVAAMREFPDLDGGLLLRSINFSG